MSEMVCLFTPPRFGIECLASLSLRGAKRRRNLKSSNDARLMIIFRRGAERAKGFLEWNTDKTDDADNDGFYQYEF